MESNAAPGQQSPLPTPAPIRPLPAHNLPVSTTAFIGREKELLQIAGLFADPDCYLLTILSPDSIGKTRLAPAAAVIARCNPFLARFYHQRAWYWYKEGQQLFDTAVQRMAAAHWQDKPSPYFITQIQVQIRLAIFHFSLGNFDDSTRWLEHCLAQLNKGAHPQEEAEATVWSGANYFRMRRPR